MQTLQLSLPLPIAELHEILRRNGVAKASVFGSYARGEASPDSDLDLLVQLAPGRTLFDLGGLQYELDEKLPGGANIMTKLNRHFEPYITPDLIEVFNEEIR